MGFASLPSLLPPWLDPWRSVIVTLIRKQAAIDLLQVGGVYDAYGSYSPGFLGAGALGVLGALILPAIAIALPGNNDKDKLNGA